MIKYFGEESDSQRQHGKRATYKFGCRCEKCRKANSEYHTNLNQRKRERAKESK